MKTAVLFTCKAEHFKETYPLMLKNFFPYIGDYDIYMRVLNDDWLGDLAWVIKEYKPEIKHIEICGDHDILGQRGVPDFLEYMNRKKPNYLKGPYLQELYYFWKLSQNAKDVCYYSGDEFHNDYKWVIRCRFDMVFLEPFPEINMLNWRKIYLGPTTTDKKWRNDRFAVIPRWISPIYANRYNDIYLYHALEGEENKIISSEMELYHTLEKNKINVEEIPSVIRYETMLTKKIKMEDLL